VQSFPDWYRFAGFRTSALRQIGEAVPPFVGTALGRKILEFIGDPRNTSSRRPKAALYDKHLKVRKALKTWYSKEAESNSLHPWRLEANLWINLMGEILFGERWQKSKSALFWANYRRDWPQPRAFLKDRHRESHLRTIGLSKRAPVLEALARYLMSSKVPLLKELISLGVNERFARRALAVCGYSHERPNDSALIRVANRVFERTQFPYKMSVDSQIATAMLVGEDAGAVVYAAAMELGEMICTSDPACLVCPVTKWCSHYSSTRN
jgi:DNA (cytosine-5)-methyltransferase 1